MLRLYFDSDVINNIRSGNFPELATFTSKNRNKLLIPFSQAHVGDKLTSKKTDEERFWREIDYITEFTRSKLLLFDDNSNSTLPKIATARAVLEEVEDTNRIVDEFSSFDNIIGFMKETSEELGEPSLGATFEGLFNIPALNTDLPEAFQGESFKEQLQKVADYMHSLRKDAGAYKETDQLFKSEFGLPSHAGQWTESTVDNIDSHLVNNTPFDSFIALLDSSFQDKDKITRYSYYMQAYLLLNMIGYKSDEIDIKKNKGMNNHIQDAMHSFYGGHCDYFVAMDKKLKAKTRALYEKFGVFTKIIHPKDLLRELETRLKPIGLVELIQETLVKTPIGTLEEEGVLKKVFRLDHYFLGHFTHMQQNFNSSTEDIMYVFTKMYTTYSDFLFYEEEDHVIKAVNALFGTPEYESTAIEKFRSENPDDRFIEYVLSNAYIKLNVHHGVLYLWIRIVNKPT